MKKVLSYLKKIGIFLGILIIFNVLLSLLNLIGVSKAATSIMTFIFQIVLFFIFGFIHGKRTNQKGFLVGFKVALISIILMFLLSIIFYEYNFKISNLVFYLVLSLSSIFGAILGKNKK